MSELTLHNGLDDWIAEDFTRGYSSDNLSI